MMAMTTTLLGFNESPWGPDLRMSLTKELLHAPVARSRGLYFDEHRERRVWSYEKSFRRLAECRGKENVVVKGGVGSPSEGR